MEEESQGRKKKSPPPRPKTSYESGKFLPLSRSSLMLGKVATHNFVDKSVTSTIETDQSNFYTAYGGVRHSLQTEDPQAV
jgi:hypothetical protein